MRNLYGPRSSPSVNNVSKTLFLLTWSEDTQGPAILWHKGPFSLCVFIFCPASHIWCLSFHTQSKSSSSAVAFPPLYVRVTRMTWIDPLPSDPSPLSFSPGLLDEGWIQQLTFQSVSSLIHDVALQTDTLNCWSLQPSLLWTLASVGRFKFLSFQVFHWKNEVLPQTKNEELRDCAYFSFTHSHTEKKIKPFLSTWMNIFFQTSVLSYIVWLDLKHIYEDNPQWWHLKKHFWSSAEKLIGDGNTFFLKSVSVYILMITCFYLIGQLCSSSWVVWDCLIFISYVFQTSFTLSLLDFVQMQWSTRALLSFFFFWNM